MIPTTALVYEGGVVAGQIPGPSVKLFDARGQSVSGAIVRFDVVQGGGSVERVYMTTTADGEASAGLWTLGTKSMKNIIRVSSDSFVPLDFSTFAHPGPPAALELLGGDRQAGFVNTHLHVPWLRLVDAYENAIAGVTVQFFGTRGSKPDFVFTTFTTDHGFAIPDLWLLGPAAGTQSITARAAGVNPVVIEAVALDQSNITAVYDLVTIDGRSPTEWGMAEATLTLGSTGHFIDVITWRTGGIQTSSGTYVISNGDVTLRHYWGGTELGTAGQSSLTVTREDYYRFMQSWVYTKRK